MSAPSTHEEQAAFIGLAVIDGRLEYIIGPTDLVTVREHMHNYRQAHDDVESWFAVPVAEHQSFV